MQYLLQDSLARVLFNGAIQLTDHRRQTLPMTMGTNNSSTLVSGICLSILHHNDPYYNNMMCISHFHRKDKMLWTTDLGSMHFRGFEQFIVKWKCNILVSFKESWEMHLHTNLQLINTLGNVVYLVAGANAQFQNVILIFGCNFVDMCSHGYNWH